MKPVPVPIGVAEVGRGFLVSLPPQLALAVGLRKTFKGVLPAAAPWTYHVPAGRGRAAAIEAWIAEAEIQARAEARRRAWTADDTEWTGAAATAAHVSPPVTLAIDVLPRKRTAKVVLQLLSDLAAQSMMVCAVSPDGVRGYRLEPSRRLVPRPIAERAITLRLLVPGNDGLFGPEWSQTWRAPTPEEVALAELRPRKAKGKAEVTARRRALRRAPQHPSPAPCSV